MIRRVLLALLFLTATAPAFADQAPGIHEQTLAAGRFGRVTIYRPATPPTSVVLFVSGDGGWNLGVVDMARALAEDGSLVVGIDVVHYIRALNASRDRCLYPAADFEKLSQYVQRKEGFKAYHYPVLVGYSSGATMVYATLVQAPPGTFTGAVSLGFSPHLWTDRLWCRGRGLQSVKADHKKGVDFLPARNLKNPWIVLQGDIDRVRSAASAKAFVDQVPNGEIVLLPKVGHGFSVEPRWMPQFRAAVARVLASTKTVERPPEDSSVADLPLVELPAAGTGTLVVIVSGDGGWASLDRSIGEYLAARGVPVVGWNALKYFWHARTPEEMGHDLGRVVRYYLKHWHQRRAVVIGYSMGADVLPFMADALPPDARGRVQDLILIAPSKTTGFEFHVSNWLGGPQAGASHALLPVLERLHGLPVMCIDGRDESESLCPDLEHRRGYTVEYLPGGHHFDGDYRRVAEVVARRLGIQ